MAEEGGVVADSTPNGLDAVPKGNAASKQVAADGVLGKARVNAAGSHTYSGQAVLQVDDSTPLDIGDDFTISGWVRMTAAPSGKGLARIFCRNRDFMSAPDWQLYITGYDVLNVQVGKDAAASGAIPSAENDWVHIAGVFDGTNFTAYANGERVFGATVPPVKDSDNRPIVVADAQSPAKFNVLGFPVILEDEVGTDIIFGDLKEGYVWNFGKDPVVDRDSSVEFRKGSEVFRVMALGDGAPTGVGLVRYTKAT